MPSPDIDTLGILEAELAKQTEYVEVLKKLVGKLSRQLTLRDAELTILREDADAYRAIEKYVENNGEVTICSNENGIQIIAPGRVLCETMGELRDALVAARLIKEAE